MLEASRNIAAAFFSIRYSSKKLSKRKSEKSWPHRADFPGSVKLPITYHTGEAAISQPPIARIGSPTRRDHSMCLRSCDAEYLRRGCTKVRGWLSWSDCCGEFCYPLGFRQSQWAGLGLGGAEVSGSAPSVPPRNAKRRR